MAVPTTRVLLDMNDSSKPDLNIKVTGFQWYWRYDYLDEGFGFYSKPTTPQDQINNRAPKDRWYLLEVDHHLVVPTNKKIRFLITSKDVNHSWWVRELGIKRDAIPGFVHSAWARIEKPGIYRGQCTELCGMLHGYMPIVVEAKTPEDYAKWLATQRKHYHVKSNAVAAATTKTAHMQQTNQPSVDQPMAQSADQSTQQPASQPMAQALPVGSTESGKKTSQRAQ